MRGGKKRGKKKGGGGGKKENNDSWNFFLRKKVSIWIQFYYKEL